MEKLPVKALFNAFLMMALLHAPVAMAQEGPPPEVRQAVSSLLAFINSEGDGALDTFVQTSLDPDWVEATGSVSVRETLAVIRRQARGSGGDVDVSRTPSGLLLTLGAAGGATRIALSVSPAGIRNLELLGEEPGGEQGREAALNSHLMALERLGDSSLDDALQEFEQQRFSARFLAETSQAERRVLLAEIREVAATAGAVMLSEQDDLVELKMRGPKSIRVMMRAETAAPFQIDLLRTEPIDGAGDMLTLEWENVAAHFDRLAAQGFSGVVHIRRGDDVALHQAYGIANRPLGIESRLDTVYGIGSTPIDFTVAGILLLAQQGRVGLDDPVTRYFPGVPPDKRGLTIRHLISGQSGLPDFHDLESDWDADLAWIDRATAVRRILTQPMLFLPGEGRAHSHSAYGLVAAIIEQVSGQSYFDFMRVNFFEPAGMTRTGMYGSAGGLSVADFAEGYGQSSVGLPNIPPNWGPTSWLVMGSGGMYSTLEDMLKFYRLVRSGRVLGPAVSSRFKGESVAIGGSDRGFYLLHLYKEEVGEVLMIINGEGRSDENQRLSRALENLLFGDDQT